MLYIVVVVSLNNVQMAAFLFSSNTVGKFSQLSADEFKHVIATGDSSLFYVQEEDEDSDKVDESGGMQLSCFVFCTVLINLGSCCYVRIILGFYVSIQSYLVGLCCYLNLFSISHASQMKPLAQIVMTKAFLPPLPRAHPHHPQHRPLPPMRKMKRMVNRLLRVNHWTQWMSLRWTAWWLQMQKRMMGTSLFEN